MEPLEFQSSQLHSMDGEGMNDPIDRYSIKIDPYTGVMSYPIWCIVIKISYPMSFALYKINNIQSIIPII